jgi:hypothetical protein
LLINIMPPAQLKDWQLKPFLPAHFAALMDVIASSLRALDVCFLNVQSHV